MPTSADHQPGRPGARGFGPKPPDRTGRASGSTLPIRPWQIGIEDEEAGWLAWPPFLATAFGMITVAPATATLAWGTRQASVLPTHAILAIFVAAPMVPLAMFLGGNVFGEAGFIGGVLTLTAAWIVIGFSLSAND